MTNAITIFFDRRSDVGSNSVTGNSVVHANTRECVYLSSRVAYRRAIARAAASNRVLEYFSSSKLYSSNFLLLEYWLLSISG